MSKDIYREIIICLSLLIIIFGLFLSLKSDATAIDSKTVNWIYVEELDSYIGVKADGSIIRRRN